MEGGEEQAGFTWKLTSRQTLYVPCSRSQHGSHIYRDQQTLDLDLDADAISAAGQ
jgi:hypothetical protein